MKIMIWEVSVKARGLCTTFFLLMCRSCQSQIYVPFSLFASVIMSIEAAEPNYITLLAQLQIWTYTLGLKSSVVQILTLPQIDIVTGGPKQLKVREYCT